MKLGQHTIDLGKELQSLSIGGLILLTLLTSAGFFAELHPYFDRLVHFRALYFGFAIPAFVILAVQRHPMGLLAMGLLGFNGWVTAPWLPTVMTPEALHCAEEMSVLAVNARGPASDHDALLELIEREDPDVVFISELRNNLTERVRSLYPHVVWSGGYDEHFGLFTKYRVREGFYMRGPNGRPTINAVVETAHGPMRILGAHPSSPGSIEGTLNRNAMLQQIATAARDSSEPVLLLGDLNTTMFSPYYEPLEDAGLVNSRAGRGVMGTWPNWSPLRIPIDHVMVSRELRVCDAGLRGDFGSDHLPFHATIGRRVAERAVTARRRPDASPR